MLPSQSPGLLQVAPVNGTTIGAWATSTTRDDASVAFQCEQKGNEFTLFFVHTTVDEAVAGPVATAGVMATYPYFVSLPWLGSDTSFANAQLNVTNPNTVVVIPPYRIIAQVRAYLNQATPPDPTFGIPGCGALGGDGAGAPVDRLAEPDRTHRRARAVGGLRNGPRSTPRPRPSTSCRSAAPPRPCRPTNMGS